MGIELWDKWVICQKGWTEVGTGHIGKMKDSQEKRLDKKLVTLMHGVKISLHVNFFLQQHSDEQSQLSPCFTIWV